MNGVTYLGIKKYAESLPNAPIGADADAMAGWKAGYVHIVRQTLLFAMEREKILSFFDRSGIWYAPMKGIILQNLYPQIGMRQIVDNDILFDGAYRKPQILPPSTINHKRPQYTPASSKENRAHVYELGQNIRLIKAKREWFYSVLPTDRFP